MHVWCQTCTYHYSKWTVLLGLILSGWCHCQVLEGNCFSWRSTFFLGQDVFNVELQVLTKGYTCAHIPCGLLQKLRTKHYTVGCLDLEGQWSLEVHLGQNVYVYTLSTRYFRIVRLCIWYKWVQEVYYTWWRLTVTLGQSFKNQQKSILNSNNYQYSIHV